SSQPFAAPATPDAWARASVPGLEIDPRSCTRYQMDEGPRRAPKQGCCQGHVCRGGVSRENSPRPRPPQANVKAPRPAHAGAALNLDEASVAWPVLCSAWLSSVRAFLHGLIDSELERVSGGVAKPRSGKVERRFLVNPPPHRPETVDYA